MTRTGTALCNKYVSTQHAPPEYQIKEAHMLKANKNPCEHTPKIFLHIFADRELPQQTTRNCKRWGDLQMSRREFLFHFSLSVRAHEASEKDRKTSKRAVRYEQRHDVSLLGFAAQR